MHGFRLDRVDVHVTPSPHQEDGTSRAATDRRERSRGDSSARSPSGRSPRRAGPRTSRETPRSRRHGREGRGSAPTTGPPQRDRHRGPQGRAAHRPTTAPHVATRPLCRFRSRLRPRHGPTPLALTHIGSARASAPPAPSSTTPGNSRDHRPHTTPGARSLPAYLRHAVPENARERVATLYWKAFGRKPGPALGPPERGRAFLARHLHTGRAVIALVGGRAVGVAGYRCRRTGVDRRRGARCARRLRDPARNAPAEPIPSPGEPVMDGITVDPAHRGAGIGSALPRETLGMARELDCRQVRLDVIDLNPRARVL
ncbi:GNAT family N-acetyltransferase (plasmid) [Streptomyces sp. BI20]|uniref:GNAT family N-acetyltransferase n=1 Tax=Streptomyces sp. BI20 TaxID=3403460 RepID=UPI003C7705B7